jgi:hypothetical protein
MVEGNAGKESGSEARAPSNVVNRSVHGGVRLAVSRDSQYRGGEMFVE